jgi:hypothetical protein
MTGLKPDGGPECIGRFRSAPAFEVDSGSEHSDPVFTAPRGGSVPMLSQFHADRRVADIFPWRPFWLTLPAAPEINRRIEQ